MAWSIFKLFKGKPKRLEETDTLTAPELPSEAEPSHGVTPDSAQRLKTWLQTIDPSKTPLVRAADQYPAPMAPIQVVAEPEETAGIPVASFEQEPIVDASPANESAIGIIQEKLPPSPAIQTASVTPTAQDTSERPIPEPDDLAARWAARRSRLEPPTYTVHTPVAAPDSSRSVAVLSPSLEGTHTSPITVAPVVEAEPDAQLERAAAEHELNVPAIELTEVDNISPTEPSSSPAQPVAEETPAARVEESVKLEPKFGMADSETGDLEAGLLEAESPTPAVTAELKAQATQVAEELAPEPKPLHTHEPAPEISSAESEPATHAPEYPLPVAEPAFETATHHPTTDWSVARSQSAPPARFSMLHAVAKQWEQPPQRPLPTKRIFVIAGSTAEARRLAPIVRTLRSRCTISGNPDDVCVCAAGEDSQAVRELLETSGIGVDCNVNVVDPGQGLDTQRARVLKGFESMFSQIRPQWLVISGDTLLTAMASLAAYYAQIHVARIDSGASADPGDIHPEEINRQIVDLFSSVHFTETDWSKETLVHEGVPESNIIVVGNPAVDALHEQCFRLGIKLDAFSARSTGVVRVLVSVGHRVVPGSDIREIARAIGNLAVLVPGLYEVFWPLPPDQDAAEAVQQLLNKVPGIRLTSGASYDQYLRYLAECDIVLTDSVDLQEEAPSLGKPVLMMGSLSRRVEAVRSGVVIPVGNDSASLQAAIRGLARKLSTRHGQITNPYGDGKASARIADFFDGTPVLEFGHTVLPRLITQPELQQLPAPMSRWRLE